MHNDSLLPFLEAARAEAARRWPNTGPAPTTALAWHDSGMATGFVLGAQWARSNAVVTDEMVERGLAINRVREMHAPGDEWCGYHNSALCECANVYCEECGFSWPCPTIQALDGGE